MNNEESREYQIYQLHQSIDRCNKCRLCEGRSCTIPGSGNVYAKIVCLFEAAGTDELRTGIPLVGRAGQLFTECLHTIQLTRDHIFMVNCVSCLDGETGIRTNDGTKRLNWIVKNKWDGDVLSVDTKTGLLVYRPITNWYRNQLTEKMYSLKFLNGKRSRHDFYCHIELTASHKVLTNYGYARTEDLKTGDLVATGTPYPNHISEQIIYGSLFGDGSISKGGSYSESHCLKQKDYFLGKLEAMSGFKYYSTYLSGIKMYRGGLHRCPYFKKMRELWYPYGKKVFPISCLKSLNNIGMAVWYQDDGYYKNRKRNTTIQNNTYVEIALGMIPEENANEVSLYFNSIGYETYPYYHDCWRLIFRYGCGYKFLENISPYIHPVMRYKLPDVLREQSCDMSIYDKQPVLTDYDHVVVNEITQYPQKSVYCIDVKDTHNFCTVSGVVHNCRPPENREPYKDEIDACFPHVLQHIDIINPDIICIGGNTAIQAILGGKEKVTQCHGKWYSFRGKRVFPIYHPAYILRNISKKAEFLADLKELERVYRLFI